LILPDNYKEGERYPLIVRLHGGPVYQFSHEFMFDWRLYAAKGYAVLAVNPRGSSGRGFDFARAIYADWGNVDVKDISAGIDHAIELGVADPERIGVGGWSYGGILTNYMIASDKRIKAAVSGAGMSNFLGGYGVDQYAREYEFEIGLPWRDRKKYDRISYPFFHADRITAPTLFKCGGADWNVPCIGSEQMFQALRSLDVETELVIYPDENHTLVRPSFIRDRLERNLNWYDRYLKSK
jgi:dipeptidyl aminopeptidase/acylaminoacyl peptidase